MKTIENKAMRHAVDAMLKAKALRKEADELYKAAKLDIVKLAEKAKLVTDSRNPQHKFTTRGVTVTISYVGGRASIDADSLRNTYPGIAERFTKVGKPFLKVEPKVVDRDAAQELVA